MIQKRYFLYCFLQQLYFQYDKTSKLSLECRSSAKDLSRINTIWGVNSDINMLPINMLPIEATNFHNFVSLYCLLFPLYNWP